MENKMETTIVYWGYINWLYGGYIGIIAPSLKTWAQAVAPLQAGVHQRQQQAVQLPSAEIRALEAKTQSL